MSAILTNPNTMSKPLDIDAVPRARDAYPPVLSIPHVKEILNVATTRAYEVVKHPDCPTFRIGNLIRIPRDSFFDWIESLPSSGDIPAI